jgi:hypothetical protein
MSDLAGMQFEVKAFEADFEAMWNRASNTIVQ